MSDAARHEGGDDEAEISRSRVARDISGTDIRLRVAAPHFLEAAEEGSSPPNPKAWMGYVGLYFDDISGSIHP